MSTDLEKSFTATLKYDINRDPAGRPDLVSTDFSYIEKSDRDGGTFGNSNPTLQNVDHQFLCINTKAPDAVTLYFRYDSKNGGYRIWIRTGSQKGMILARTNPGYIYANKNYDRPHFWRLAQRDVGGSLTPTTEFDYKSELILQVLKGSTWTNIGLYAKKIPDSSAPDLWWSYIETGNQDTHWWLDDIKYGVDYEPSDVWGAGKL
jgi:hypothetical protein